MRIYASLIHSLNKCVWWLFCSHCSVATDDLTFGSPLPQDHKRSRSSATTKRPMEDMSLDIERTVRQLEKRLEQEEELKQDEVHKDYQTSVVPEVAEDLGSGKLISFIDYCLRHFN